MMKNKIFTIERFYDECLSSIEYSYSAYKKEQIWFIKKHFEELISNFNDLNSNTILLFSEVDTKIIRTIYGLYDSGKPQTLDETSKRFGVSEQMVLEILKNFEKNVKMITTVKLNLYISSLVGQEQKEKDLKWYVAYVSELGLSDKLIFYLKWCSNIQYLTQLLSLSKEELLQIGDIHEYEVEKLIKLVHSLKLKFADELTSEQEKMEQEEIFNNIRCFGMKKIIEQNGSPKYEIDMVEELFLDIRIEEKLKKKGIITIKQLLALTPRDLSKIFILRSQQQYIIEKISSLGFEFAEDITVKSSLSQKLTDALNKKLKRKEKLESQIHLLEDENACLDVKIDELSVQNNNRIGDKNARKNK